MKLVHVINRRTKRRYLVTENQFKMLTNEYEFKVAFMREVSIKHVFFKQNATGIVDIDPESSIAFNELGFVTLQQVLDKEWVLMPETLAAWVLYGN